MIISEGRGRESVSELTILKNYKKLYTVLLLGCFYLLYMLYPNLSRVFCCWF